MAPPFVYQSSAVTEALKLPANERKSATPLLSFREGLKAASLTALIWLPITSYWRYGNSNTSKFFQSRFNTSSRTAVTIMPILFAFGMVSEQVASRLANPQAFETTISKRSSLSFPKRAANYAYEHPFKTVFMLGVPAVLAVYISEAQDASLTFSQRLMHTRVIGQFYIITLLMVRDVKLVFSFF